jgi:hypothetical protein
MRRLVVVWIVLGLGVVFFHGEVSAEDNGQPQLENIRTGARNASTGWVRILDGIAENKDKGKEPFGGATAAIAGAGVGVRRALHQTSAGIIELATFWIPKKTILDTENSAKDLSIR